MTPLTSVISDGEENHVTWEQFDDREVLNQMFLLDLVKALQNYGETTHRTVCKK